MSLNFNVTLDRDEDGAWIVECPAQHRRRYPSVPQGPARTEPGRRISVKRACHHL
jgi:hypothetical protein